MTLDQDARQLDELDLIEMAAAALVRGDWRTAIRTLSRVSGESEIIDVAVSLRCVARSMRFQSVVGGVQAAQHQLDTAARTLMALQGHLDVGDEPAAERRWEHLTWAATRLVVRELADLAALRLLFGKIARGRPELTYACIEFLTWVDHDPYTVRVDPSDRELDGLDSAECERFRTGNRLDMCSRATQLRHFADARAGSVSERGWQGMGGYPYLRMAALTVLAKEPATRGRPDVPVRLGRLRAWEYACRWVIDTDI